MCSSDLFAFGFSFASLSSNTGTQRDAFFHPCKTCRWGFKPTHAFSFRMRKTHNSNTTSFVTAFLGRLKTLINSVSSTPPTPPLHTPQPIHTPPHLTHTNKHSTLHPSLDTHTHTHTHTSSTPLCTVLAVPGSTGNPLPS